MDLSVIIPSRNEQFLNKTIESILKARRAKTEIIVILDGAWPVEPVEDHPDVILIHHAQSIGQRAAINEGARLSQAKFIMKLDAHCALSDGFDEILMRDCQYDWTLVPRLYNLHAFDWQCLHCKNRTYQGPKPKKCGECGTREFEQVIVWQPRWNRKTDSMRFDRELVFKYWGSYGHRAEVQAQGEISDTMSLLGACFFMHRERYWELGGSDEGHGSWGQQGTEIALKSWLSGGRLAVHKGCWYSHLFRTQPGFGFPYPLSQSEVEKARKHSRDLWLNDKWPLAKYPLSWLVEKFKPVPDWHTEGPAVHTKQSKGICYYTENRLPEPYFSAVQEQLKRAAKQAGDLPIVSVSLKPINFGSNIVLGLQRSIRTMFEQILAGLSDLDTDIAYLCEHDCLYPKEHFDFTPPRKDVYFYDQNTWKVNAETGHAIHYICKQVSGLCADRRLLIDHYRRRLEKMADNVRVLTERGEPVKNDGHSRHTGYEPGCHAEPRGIDNFKAEGWMSPVPIIDIRHSGNLSKTRWSPSEFRDKSTCLGWTESDTIPGWGKTEGRFLEFLIERDLVAEVLV